jgi:hypothetical protein
LVAVVIDLLTHEEAEEIHKKILEIQHRNPKRFIFFDIKGI